MVEIFQLSYKTRVFYEVCTDNFGVIKNTYNIDAKGIVRKSKQFHSDTIGYLLIERLDK